MRRALFLDRDGVINRDTGYPHRPRDLRFMPGALALMRAGMARGYALVMVTNQAGIGRGLYGEAAFRAVTRWLLARLARHGIAFRGVEYCPAHPVAGRGAYRRDTPRRKPGPGMILDAARRHGLLLRASIMVGDRATDATAARAAGVGRAVLVGDPAERRAAPPGTLLHASLRRTARWLPPRPRAAPPAAPRRPRPFGTGPSETGRRPVRPIPPPGAAPA